MKLKRRDGTMIERTDGQEKLLKLLYGTVWGRMLLRPLTAPAISELAGKLLSTRLSCILINPFIRHNHIDMSQFEKRIYDSYNDFFSRKIRAGLRPVDMQPQHLISPCDSKLTVLPVTEKTSFMLKHTRYRAASLLKNEQLADEYAGGFVLIFRLSVEDYHRYIYIADGEKTENVRIPGVFHTVNPIANDYYPIYKENAREYSTLHTREFGDILMMEVGALLVGKIVNHHEKAHVRRGQEKGYFQFGGSTVVLLLKKNTVRIDGDILNNSRQGVETIVRCGEKIGTAVSGKRTGTDGEPYA